MARNLKIHLLLLLLTLGFALTALTINFTYRKEEVLNIEGEKIERHLHKKEQFVKNFLDDPAVFTSLKNIENNEDLAQKTILKSKAKEFFYFCTYKSGKLKFWSSIRVLLETDDLLKEGSTFFLWKNGWYEAIKKTDGNFSVICFIPIKANYPYQNQYLRNSFSPDISTVNDIEIAKLNDNQVFNVRNISGKYIFSLKLKLFVNDYHSPFELMMWVLSLVCGLIFLNYLCVWIVQKGLIKISILALISFIISLRFIDLKYSWLEDKFNIELFNHKYYTNGFWLPSIGAFLLNILALTWILSFIYNYRFKINISNKPLNKFWSYLLFLLLPGVVYLYAYQLNNLFYHLVIHSSINFEVTNVLNLNWLSWLSILIYCFAVLNLYLLIKSVLALTDTLSLSNKERLNIFFAVIGMAFLSHLFLAAFNIFFLFFAIIILLIGWSFYQYKRHFNAGVFIAAILVFALLSSLKLSQFQYYKERETRKILAAKLETSNDPNAALLFSVLEKEILKDNFVLDYFKDPLGNHNILTNRLKKLYLAGYLSKFEFKSFEYNSQDIVLRGETEVPLSNFKNLVLAGSYKISDYFYRVNNTFGFQKYFALLPIKDNNQTIGTLIIELKSKRLNDEGTFPELLVDGKIKEDIGLKNYSYAYYGDGRLFNQYGKYIYNLKNNTFNGKLKNFVFTQTIDNNNIEYNHLIYQPNKRKLIVISKEVTSLLQQLAAVSFIFLILLLFSFIIFLLRWIWLNSQNYNVSFRNFRWSYLITTNRMLYKTRIQLSMVSTVVFTLLLTGLITFYNISKQYSEQQEESILNKVNKIAESFDKQLIVNGALTLNEQTELNFNDFAEFNGVDLNLFDTEGNLMMSTQPKIYQNGLVARKMNALAYVYLNKFQKAECVNKEQIGRLLFLTAYVPLRNSKHEPIAYLGLPYFSNERDYQDRIGIFVNALINVYTLVFVAIGFIAVFVANKITNPLTIIQNSLNETNIGRKNESIPWKRNDEIGQLIKSYNNMIGALEDSAQKLARSERESAWREMAKQVAHEIKNPLTPLKLGVQLLEKSWKEKDPNFDEKFKKFSKSFIEQIESLAHIASEFSNFAKMPDTILQDVNLFSVIEKSIELFRQSENVTITFNKEINNNIIVKADKDQLLLCFNNLIKNAVEAIPDKRAGLIKFNLYCTKENASIEIYDNGSGIAEHLQKQIFVPNFTTKSSGTGLGLAFVKQALENMGGSIRFETKAEIGTTFFLTIPLVSC
ncbi:MAG: HAMP domain-containing sensor histidine kinase [Daejeonella sp.]